MSTTTADRLALLLRTKQWQRRELEKRYPSLDFDEVPFSAYRQLWMGRSYVRGLVGAWNAYGRSNTDADRDVLYDYSGHGRDIRLYNFAFEGMSGYGGYAQDFNNVGQNTGTGLILEQDSTHVKIQNVNPGIGQFVASMDKSLWNNTSFSLNVTGADSQTRLVMRNTDVSYTKTIHLSEGLNIVEPLTDDEWQQVDNIYFAISVGATVTFELLPVYPGGLVSDGIDDYGQCVKGFALPDDYTIVAIRKPISANGAAFTSKGRTTGAFLFEAGSVNYSYGQSNNVGNNIPALFSYMSKNSYNGETIKSGTEADTEDDVFEVFRHNSSFYNQSVLYDERIYDHSLTKEEIQLVEDDMMFDYGDATGGGISDIHYVCDFDAKGRSNDEDEPMRSQWIDKAAGKVIDLHNYAFAGMSGYGGYVQNFLLATVVTNIGDITEQTETKITVTNISPTTNAYSVKLTKANYNNAGFYLRAEYSNPADIAFRFAYTSSTGSLVSIRKLNPNGLTYVEPIPNEEWTQIENIYLRILPGTTATIEQMPLYPGALVSDGVDDYGVAQEVINDNIGYALLHYNRLIENPSNWGYYMDGLYSRRLYISYKQGGDIYTNLTRTIDDGKILTGKCNYTEPASEKLNVASNNESRERGQVAIYRLILIREQLDGAQVEFLRWKVEKEYRDWCKANGYEYAINQLTE